MKFFTPSHILQQQHSEQSSPDSDINLELSKKSWQNVSRSSKFILVRSLVVAIGGLTIPLMTSIAAQAAPLTCSTIYGDVYSSTQIYSINTTNAIPTAAAVLPVPSNIGIAVIPGATPTLFSDSLSPIHLNSTNGTTTTNTPAATFGSSYGGGLGTDTSGRLFFIGNNGSGQHLWRFNSVSGPATDIGAITSSLAGDTVWPRMSPGDMMSDANGRLYYFGSDYVLTGGLYTNYLYYVDANLVAHRLGSYTSAQTGIGVAFDPSGTIFTLNRNLLYKIDLTAGFTASLVGDTKNPGFIDLASCALPTMNPAVTATKTVQDVTTIQNPATIVSTNDILQYNVTFTNTGNLPSDNTKFIDTIPAGSTYVAGSTQMCNAAGAACATIPDVGGVAPFVGTGTLVKTAGQGAGVLLTGAANNAVLTFKVKVISTGVPAKIVNTGQASYPTVSGGLPSTNTVSTTTATVPVKVPPVTVSGTVFDDADGSRIKDGTEALSTVAGLNAVLVDTTTSKVIATTAVVNGVFSFSNVPGNVDYTLQITTATAVVGSAPPAVILPTNWVSTGENLNGVTDSTIDGIIAVPVTVSNVTNVNLGIEQLPNSNDLTPASQVNPGGTATVQVPTLVGTDPEDNILGIVKKFKIVTLPQNGTLYYNGIAVTLGQVIANYDPLLLTIDPTANTADTISFTYAAIDLAGQPDPTPATVTVAFSAPIISGSALEISGTVFEDPNYGGGAGRPLNTPTTAPQANARVELYDATGIFKGFALTDNNGLYKFNATNVTGGIIAGDYKVRVVNNTVGSSRLGYTSSLVPIQTFRTDATTSIVINVTDHVGGEKPIEVDAPGNTTNANLSTLDTVTEEVQSLTTVKVGSSDVTGIDFGYNFDTIVNTNNAGQGSLRQFIINSNTLGGEVNLAQAGSRKNKFNGNQSLPAGVETSIFMIPSGSDPLGRTKDPGFDTTRGVAQIIPQNLLPTITGVNANSTSIDGTTQTVNVGDNNAGVLGRGGKVGVDQLTLNQVQRPEIEIFGNNQFNGVNDRGLKADGVADFTARGLATYNFYISIEANNATRPTVEQNILGSKADNWADPTTNRDIHKNLLFNTGTQNGLVQNNLLGFTTNNDALTFERTTNSTITNNDCQAGATNAGAVGDCYTLYDSNTNNTIRGNLATDISANGIDILRGSNNNLIENNTIKNAGLGGVETAGIRVTDYYPTPLLPSNSNTIKRNIISGSVGSGILVTSGLSNTITENSLYANGALGIDLLKSTELASRNTGIAPYITANDGLTDSAAANNDIDYPIITSTNLDATGTLQVAGYVGKPVNVANFGGAKLEFFIADNSPANQNGEVILGDGKSKPHGEGRTFIGSCTAASDSKFSCSFATAGTLGLTAASNITATATDSSGNTSEFSAVLSNPANLVLVKRITAIKDADTNITTTFSNFVDDGTANNLLPGWNVGTGSYLLGALNNGAVKIKPADEVEYTIYYLNSGGNPISKARVCDRLNNNLIFQPQFSTATTSTQGIEFVKNASTSYPSNAEADNDGGFLSTSSTLPINCNLTANTTFNVSNISDNIVVVDVAKIANPLLGIVSDPLPGGQRGYVRFKVRVQQ
jgi:uncharacterized repeat protein (TIGR01451 family)